MDPSRSLSALPRLLCFIRTAAYSSAAVTAPTIASNSSFPLKNVTKLNFEAALSELRTHVRAADFVAVDLEMTGITSAPWRESLEFDRFDIRYLKVKDSAEKFAVVQFGVCPFRWDSAKNSFVAHPHNFFVFPRHEIQVDGPSSEFLCQTTSMEFLAKYQFDFNACIREGISYLSRAHEDAARKRLNFAYGDEMSDASSNVIRDKKRIGIADVLFKERMKNRLHEWRDRLLSERNMEFQGQEGSNDYQRQFQTIFFKMRPALTLSDFTSHQIRLIRLVIKKHFEDLCFVVVNDGDDNLQQLVVYVDSRDDKELLMQEVNSDQKEAAEMKIQSAIGFRHVIDLLASEKKLIIGHNCFLDIAHIHTKFIGSLPSTAEEFVSSIGKHFPYIMDTKILLNGNSILQRRMKKSSTSLSSAFGLLCPHIAFSSQSNPAFKSGVRVEVQVDDLRSSNWNSGDKHEAGYDAFMTGCVFAQACNLIGIDFALRSPSENLVDNENLQKHVNHLYLSWASGDIIDLSTGNRMTESLRSNRSKKHQAKISFENIVLIWGFPTHLNAREIKECISKVFGLTNVVSVYHLDESAVFVQFAKPEMVSEFLDLKENLERHDDPISVLHPLTKLFEARTTHAAGYEAYKKICSSPISKLLFADQAEAVGINQKTALIKSEAVKSQMHEAVEMLNETTEIQGMEMGSNDLSSTNYHSLRSSSM